MNRLLILSLLLPLLLSACATDFRPPPGVHIPENLEEAYVELDNMLTTEQKEALRTGETPVSETILNFGMQLKEYWGLWRDSKMAKYMRRRDIDHPDHMITIIFEGYVQYLREQE